MRKILALSVAALLVMGLVGGGTWAYFTDTETSDGSFLAGTLDLGLYGSTNTSSTGSISGSFSASDWAPGDTEDGSIFVNNNGSIALTHLNFSIDVDAFTDGTPATVDAGGGGDTDNISKMIYVSTATFGGSPVATLVGQTLDDLDGTPVDLGTLAASTEKELAIQWTFNTTATNGCQGDQLDITINFEGTQEP
jgi:spore coat-associated protein N